MPLDQLLREGQAVPIVRWDDSPLLHRRAQRVEEFGPDLWNVLSTMFATNRAANGAGLAAQQIGVDLAVFVYEMLDDHGARHAGLVCNPIIEMPHAAGRRLAVEHEGCLSLPGAYTDVPRPDYATCTGQDQFGQPITVTGTGYFARCLQHETDHINGIVMEDRLPKKARRALRNEHIASAMHYPRGWPA